MSHPHRSHLRPSCLRRLRLGLSHGVRRHGARRPGLQSGTSLPATALLLGSVVFLVATLSGCGQGTTKSSEPFLPVSLWSLWSEVEIQDQVTLEAPSTKGKILFGGEGSEDVRWEAMSGIEDLRLEDGVLKGRTVSDKPILLLELPEALGVDDELWSISFSLLASDGNRAAMHTLGLEGPSTEELIQTVPRWSLASPLEPGVTEVRPYTVVLDKVFKFMMPPTLSEIRRVLVSPSNVSGAEFALESVELTFRKQRLAAVPSGLQWIDLSDVYRETLVSRSPETLSFPVTLPERAWLDVTVGSPEAEPPIFEVSVEADGKTETLHSEAVDSSETWQQVRVDLSSWAGQSVKVALRAASDQPGTLAFWGSPTVRQSVAVEASTEPTRTEPSSTEPTRTGEGDSQRPQTVVVFLIDTLRADHLEAWGHHRETAPTLKRLADEGVRFADAVSQATWTKASVTSMLTSLYPSTTGVLDLNDRISASETTLAEIFREAGYATFATSSVPFSGQLTRLHQGVEVMYEVGALGPQGDGFQSKTAEPWMDRYLEWLDHRRDVPTFALIHVMDPHSPFKPRPPYDTLFSTPEDEERFNQQAEQLIPHIRHPLMKQFLAPTLGELESAGVDPESFVTQEKNWYDASIRGADEQLNRLMDTLSDFELHKKTLLAVVSDHGEELLDHGKHWHGDTVYGEVSHVPMVFWGQGVPAGKVVEQTVQNLDILPTLAGLASLPVPERAQGRSLVPLMEDESSARPLPAFTESHRRTGEPLSVYPRFSIIGERFKLIWNDDAPDTVPVYELYDHDADPLDQDNVAEAHPEIVESMAAELKKWRSWAESKRLDEEADTAQVSPEELEQLRSLGYIE